MAMKRILGSFVVGTVAAASLLLPSSPAQAAPAPVAVVAPQAPTTPLTQQCQTNLADGKHIVARGSRGECVKLVQVWLGALSTAKARGFNQPDLAVDGVFGPKTRSQVMAFQKLVYPDAGPVDGIVGPKTAKAMVAAAK